VRLFQEVRRRHGAGVALTAARCLLGGFTVAVAFLPASPGAGAVALLAGCRLLQGVAMGGVSGREQPRAERTAGWFAAGLAGLVAAAAVFAAFGALLERADFLAWGWRYPFILAIPANIAALFADLRLLTTGPGTVDGRRVARLVSTGGVSVDREA
jgi:MFS family permease